MKNNRLLLALRAIISARKNERKKSFWLYRLSLAEVARKYCSPQILNKREGEDEVAFLAPGAGIAEVAER